MTPQELYQHPHDALGSLDMLGGTSSERGHVPELGESFDHNQYNITSDRVEIRVLKDFHFDYRRFWRLATVWFDGKPVMVIQNAGREGEDYVKRFITDPVLFRDMLHHIRDLLPIAAPGVGRDIVSAEADVKNLTDFYGNKLGGYFQPF